MIVAAAIVLWLVGVFGTLCLIVIYLAALNQAMGRIADALRDHDDRKVVPLWPPRKPAA